MLTFDEAYKLIQTIGSHAAFEDVEAKAYFDILMSAPEGSRIVEIGLQFGRSSSVALQVAKARGLKYVGIDSFCDEYGETARPAWFKLAEQVGVDVLVYEMDSSTVPIDGDIAVILIDGDHSYAGVTADCEHFLPHVCSGGFALFHDSLREGLPEVGMAATSYFVRHDDWTFIKIVESMAIWRKN